MNRRGFFERLAGVVVAGIAAPSALKADQEFTHKEYSHGFTYVPQTVVNRRDMKYRSVILMEDAVAGHVMRFNHVGQAWRVHQGEYPGVQWGLAMQGGKPGDVIILQVER